MKRRGAGTRCGILLVLLPLIAAASDGELDPSFAGNGKAVVGFAQNHITVDATAYAVVVQPDQKILLAGITDSGTTTDSVLTRLNADGTLDAGFGDQGRAGDFFILPAGTSSYAAAIALQVDGKIIVFGYIQSDTSSAYVIRLSATGQLDPTFGIGGRVIYPGAGQGEAIFSAGAVTSTGDILATGLYYADANDGLNLLNVLFDQAGTVKAAQSIGSVNLGFHAAIVLQPDSKAVIAEGESTSCTVLRINVGQTLTLDSTFGTGGTAEFDWNLDNSSSSECYALALQKDGRILMGGDVRSDQNNLRASVLRLLPDGTLDPSFGKKLFGFASSVSGIPNTTAAILVQADQRIVLAGIAGTHDPAHSPADFGALRLLSDGTLDATFTASTPGSSLGKVVFGFETTAAGRDDFALCAALQNNRLVLAGTRGRSDNSIKQFAIARLQNDAIFVDGFEAVH